MAYSLSHTHTLSIHLLHSKINFSCRSTENKIALVTFFRSLRVFDSFSRNSETKKENANKNGAFISLHQHPQYSMRVCNALILRRTTTSSFSSKPFTLALYPKKFLSSNSFSATIIIAVHSGCLLLLPLLLLSLFYCISKLIQHFSLSLSLSFGLQSEWFLFFFAQAICSHSCHGVAHHHARVHPATKRQKWSNTKCVRCTYMCHFNSIFHVRVCAYLSIRKGTFYSSALSFAARLFFIIYFHLQLFLFFSVVTAMNRISFRLNFDHTTNAPCHTKYLQTQPHTRTQNFISCIRW